MSQSSEPPSSPTRTQTPTMSPAVPVLEPTLVASLAQDLAGSGWSVDRIDALVSARARDALMRDQRVPALLELRDLTEPAAVLTRLFVLGSTEDAATVDDALPGTAAQGLAALGLALVENGLVTALFDLRPHQAVLPSREGGGGVPTEDVAHTWWVVSDLSEATTGRPLANDHVLGIGGATVSLLGLTMRDHVGTALDIGTGCGIQALYLATHADRVVATDLSGRACAITSFNAALNGADIDVRQGSLLEPVRGEVFDLIVSNPPFVITPDSVRDGRGGTLEYRDAGMDRDTLIATLVRGAPAHLAPGGTLQILANWEIPVGADLDSGWQGRPASWLEGLPVDAWVVQRDVLDPTRYIEMWLRDSGGALMSRERWERAYADWLEDFDRAGVGAIGLGFIVLHRPAAAAPAAGSGAAPSRAGLAEPSSVTAPGSPSSTAGLAGHSSMDEPGLSSSAEGGAHGDRGERGGSGFARVFTHEPDGRAPRGVDVAQTLRVLRLPSDLWDVRLRRAGDVTEERHLVPGEAGPRAIILHQGAGLGRSIAVGSGVAALVGAADGELTVGQITTAVAVLTDQDVSDLRGQIEVALPELIRAGMLEVVEDA